MRLSNKQANKERLEAIKKLKDNQKAWDEIYQNIE